MDICRNCGHKVRKVGGRWAHATADLHGVNGWRRLHAGMDYVVVKRCLCRRPELERWGK